MKVLHFRTSLLLCMTIILFISPMLPIESTLSSDSREINFPMPFNANGFTLSNTSSGIELIFGGDYVDHDVTIWENVNESWQEDYSFDVFDPEYGLIFDIIVADIDGDDEQETIIANSGSMIHICEYEGDEMIMTHNLTHPDWDNDQIISLAVGDLDNDDSPYLEILGVSRDTRSPHSVIFKRIGDSYQPVFNISSTEPGGAAGCLCAVGDIDNNGDSEFIVTEWLADSDGLSRLRLFDWQTDTWVNIENYDFVVGDFLNLVETVQIVDADNDEANEVLINQNQEWVHLLEYSGGSFSKSWSCSLLTVDTDFVMAGDITNDDSIDIIVPDPNTDLIYIYETVGSSITNTFNISFVHDNHFNSPGYNCMDIGDLTGDGENEWVFVHWNETAFPHEYITIFNIDQIIQESPTGYLYASTVAIGNYDSDEPSSDTTSTTNTTTTTTATTDGSTPISPEILVIVAIVPVALIIVALVYKRQRS